MEEAKKRKFTQPAQTVDYASQVASAGRLYAKNDRQ